MKENITAQIEIFRATLQAAIQKAELADKHKKENLSTFEVMMGKKNARIVKVDGYNQNKNVYCFVDLSTGDILKAVGWAAPAKGVRSSGNIYGEDMLAGCCRHGVAYKDGSHNTPLIRA